MAKFSSKQDAPNSAAYTMTCFPTARAITLEVSSQHLVKSLVGSEQRLRRVSG